MRTLHPNDLGVERRIHEAYKNQRFIGRDFEEADDETPYSTMITFDPRTMVPTTPMPSMQLKATTTTTKRAFKVVKKRKKAEALAARARHLTGGGQKDS